MTHDPNQNNRQNPEAEDAEDFPLNDLLPQYFALCRRDLERLRAASESRQFGEIRVLGHNLKGSGGAYGFPELSRIGANIELAAKSGDDSTVRVGIDQLAAFLSAHIFSA
jgi:HPt (histidine-containing phosphotransfer) domain-containing protein